MFWEFVINRYCDIYRDAYFICGLNTCSSSDSLVNGRWDTDGCVRNDSLSNSTQTVCECTHLTNFAVIVTAPPGKPRPRTDEPVTNTNYPSTPSPSTMAPTPSPLTPDNADEAQQQLRAALEEVLALVSLSNNSFSH